MTLLSGSLLAQLIPFLLAPVIARLYYPSDYAVLAAYSSISILLTIVATGMYDSALMLDNTDEEAVNTASVAVSITLLLSVLSGIVIIFFRDIIAEFTGNESVTFWLYLIPLTVFFTGLYNTLAVWTNRRKRYKRLAVNRVIQTFFITGLTVGLGFLGLREKGLLISMISGQAIACLLLLLQSLKDDSPLFSFIKKEQIKLAFKRHLDFPKYSMPQGFLDGLRESSIILIISNNFTPVILGSYSYAVSILNRPLQIIGNAFGQVFYQSATEKFNNKKDLHSFSIKTIKTLALISAPFFIVLILFGRQIFGFVLGARWADAGFYAQILGVWLYFRFILSPITKIPIILKKQKAFFIFGLIYNISMPLSLFITITYTTNFLTVLFIFTIVGVINYIAQLYWIKRILLL